LASPISKSNPIKICPILYETNEPKWKINQGELYRFRNERDIAVKNWLQEIYSQKWKTFLFGNEQDMMKDTMVKISSISLHASLVPMSKCWKALKELHSSMEATKTTGNMIEDLGVEKVIKLIGELKVKEATEIAKMNETIPNVLLGFAQIEGRCLIVMIKDHSRIMLNDWWRKYLSNGETGYHSCRYPF
jgi:hypothetical protein